MRTFILCSLFLVGTVGASMAQKEEAATLWESLLNKQELAQYFSGIFEKMAFVIEETDERFTVGHHGDHFTLSKGIVENEVDYLVRLKMENVKNLIHHSADGEIDEGESFRIMAVLFTPLTEASLTNPTMTKPLMRKMAGIENHIHVNLISPDTQDTVSHTLIYLNKEWTVIPGRHGNAKRTFNLAPQDAVDYQRNVFIALKAHTMKAWKEFKKWYVKWRVNVSVTAAKE
jgi:hypothetical protein